MFKCKCGETKNYFGLPFQVEPILPEWHIVSNPHDPNLVNTVREGCLHHKEKENNMDSNALFNAVKNFVTQAHDLLDEFENDLAAIEANESDTPAPIVVQGRLRGDTLHLQRGTPGNYTTADVQLSMAQAESITNSVPDSESFAGTGRPYLTGVEYPDGSIAIGGVAVNWPNTASEPISSRR